MKPVVPLNILSFPGLHQEISFDKMGLIVKYIWFYSYFVHLKDHFFPFSVLFTASRFHDSQMSHIQLVISIAICSVHLCTTYTRYRFSMFHLL